MAATLKLDRFQLLWYLEGACGKSHLRWDIYKIFIEDVFPQLSEDEREFVYAYAKRDLSWHFEGKYVDETPHEYFKQMLARFNPANQYKVTLKNGCKKEIIDAYKWDGRFFVGMNRFCADEYIKEVEHKKYKKCNNGFCCSRERCLRHVDEIDINEPAFNDNRSFACEKCDLIIEQIENKNNNN